MAKVKSYQNYHLKVEPRFYGDTTFREHLAALKQIRAAILRHVDDIDLCEADYDTVYNCSLCGSRWEEIPKTGCPACCNAAGDEWAKEQGGVVCPTCSGWADLDFRCPKCQNKGYVTA